MRDALERMGLVKLMHDENDAPNVVESWMKQDEIGVLKTALVETVEVASWSGAEIAEEAA